MIPSSYTNLCCSYLGSANYQLAREHEPWRRYSVQHQSLTGKLTDRMIGWIRRSHQSTHGVRFCNMIHLLAAITMTTKQWMNSDPMANITFVSHRLRKNPYRIRIIELNRVQPSNSSYESDELADPTVLHWLNGRPTPFRKSKLNLFAKRCTSMVEVLSSNLSAREVEDVARAWDRSRLIDSTRDVNWPMWIWVVIVDFWFDCSNEYDEYWDVE